MRARLGSVLAAVTLALAASGCTVEARKVLGDQCDLNSDCAAPLVCGLGRCRKECVASRDCALGLRCILLQDPTLGVCQLEEETTCTLDSDCPEPLVCTDLGCMNECAEDRDCAAGQVCDDDGRCAELVEELCVYDSDCPYPLICSDRLQCEVECVDAADCDDGRACVQAVSCDGPCMCRQPCDVSAECEAGLECVECGDGLECGGAARYCERPADE
ncbi:MAG TPA: hypothetical protein RMH99_25445 [Sandaracinaceae bacterium LLY-WYZ-13_1]|nr:hypothetical protein [Sandaracinaceae bacterium LLY-WYZ-13_1]